MPTQPITLILASGSPRRYDLLTEAGYQFEVIPPNVEEIEDPNQPIEDVTRINARRKTEAVARVHPNAVVIGADTLVLRDGFALSKPADLEEAGEMIRSLNGRSHEVFTAVCIAESGIGAPIREFTVITEVKFKNLSDEELDHYHRMINPLDKAGAYAAQDHGEMILESIHGSMTNVIGLPMDEVNAALKGLLRD